MDDNVIPFEDEATDSMPREVKGILVYHRGKDKRNKSIRWKAESTLVSVRYFEMDEDERVNVNKQKFENMREFETKMEKAALSQASKTDMLRGLSNGVIMIPLEDKEADEGSCHDYTNEGWPEAKMNKVENEYAANLSSAFSLPPALSSLLATIETGGLESIIPSPGSLSQEDQSTLAAH